MTNNLTKKRFGKYCKTIHKKEKSQKNTAQINTQIFLLDF